MSLLPESFPSSNNQEVQKLCTILAQFEVAPASGVGARCYGNLRLMAKMNDRTVLMDGLMDGVKCSMKRCSIVFASDNIFDVYLKEVASSEV